MTSDTHLQPGERHRKILPLTLRGNQLCRGLEYGLLAF